MTALPLPNFRGHEADEFTFYRIPKLLTTDERLRTISTDVKLLYGILLSYCLPLNPVGRKGTVSSLCHSFEAS